MNDLLIYDHAMIFGIEELCLQLNCSAAYIAESFVNGYYLRYSIVLNVYEWRVSI